MSVKSGKLLAAEDLLQSHICVDRSLPKLGTKDFKPTGSWLERKQIQTALDECKQLLEEERVEKLGALAEAYWNEKRKLAEVTRKVGKHWQTMGFEQNGKLFLYAEEALHLLETNCLELLFHGVPMSIQQAYSILLSNGSGCSLKEYRTYAHLMRQGFRLLRHSKEGQPTNYEHRIRLDQHVMRKRPLPDDQREAVPSISQPLSFNPLSPEGNSNSDPGTSHGSSTRIGNDRLQSGRESGNASANRRGLLKSQNGGTGREVSVSCVKSESEVEMEVESVTSDDYQSKRAVKRKASGAGEVMNNFAQSIVNMGKSLIKTETEDDNEELGLESLRQKILDMLENHFQGQISQEAMDAVSLNASRAILVHVNENPDGKLAALKSETSDAEKSPATSDEIVEDTKPVSAAVAPSTDTLTLSNGSQIEVICTADDATKVNEESRESSVRKETEAARLEELSESTTREETRCVGQSPENPETAVQQDTRLVKQSPENPGTAAQQDTRLVDQSSENPETAVQEETTLVDQSSESPETAVQEEIRIVEQSSEKNETAVQEETRIVDQSSENPETAVQGDSRLVDESSEKPEIAVQEETRLVEHPIETSDSAVQKETGRVGKSSENVQNAVADDIGLVEQSSEKVSTDPSTDRAAHTSDASEEKTTVVTSNLPVEKPMEVSASESTEVQCDDSEASPVEQLSENSVPDKSGFHPNEQSSGSAARTGGQTPLSEKSSDREIASTEIETTQTGNPCESFAHNESETRASEELSESSVISETTKQPTEKFPQSTVQLETGTTEKSPEDCEHEEVSVVNNCDIPLRDTQQSQMSIEGESDIANQRIIVDQDKISDTVTNTEATREEGCSGNASEERSEETTISLESAKTEADAVSVEKRKATESSKKAVDSNESNIAENVTEKPKNPTVVAENIADETASPACSQASPLENQAGCEDILECDVSDAGTEESSNADAVELKTEAMVVDDDVVEIEDPHTWKNVKVERTTIKNEKSPQKRTLSDSNGWRSYKESLFDTLPDKRRRLSDGFGTGASGKGKQPGIEVIDISEDGCARSFSTVQPKKEIEIVDLDESESSESEEDTTSEESGEAKPDIVKEPATPPPKVQSAFERARDLRRRQILDSFPNMYDKAVFVVSVANRHLLPPNINPVQTIYTIHRRNMSADKYSRPQTFPRFQNRRFFSSPRFNNYSNAPRNNLNHPRQLNPHPSTHPHRQHQPQHPRFNAPVVHQIWPRTPLIPTPNNLPINPMQAFQMITSILLPMFGISPNCNPFSGQQLMIHNENQQWNQNMMWQQPPRRNLTPWQNSPPWRYQPRPQQWGNNRPNRPWQPRHERPNFHDRDQEEIPERPKRPALLNSPRPVTPVVDTRSATSENVPAETRRPKRPFGFRSNFNVSKPATDFLTEIEDEIRWRKIEESDSDSSDSECSQEITITPVQRPLGDSQSELRPLLRLDQCVDSASIMASLQVIATADVREFAVAEHCRFLKISFDIYQPNAPFKKSHPSKPNFRLCVMGVEEAVPSPGEIAVLLSGIHDDVPLIFALVHPEDVSFYHYSGVDIPKQAFSS